jgi:3-phosphoshikimate 1-carboxyvinyltransferase
MRRRFAPAQKLRGTVTPPADKSISHRAALFAAMCDEPVTVHNYLDAHDTRSTLDAITALGAVTDEPETGSIVIRGVGLRTPAPTTGGLLNVGNAGTLLRILPGWLAGQKGGEWTLDGDASIRQRPVDRIVEPLRAMGASIEARDDRLPPVRISGADLTGIT